MYPEIILINCLKISLYDQNKQYTVHVLPCSFKCVGSEVKWSVGVIIERQRDKPIFSISRILILLLLPKLQWTEESQSINNYSRLVNEQIFPCFSRQKYSKDFLQQSEHESRFPKQFFAKILEVIQPIKF